MTDIIKLKRRESPSCQRCHEKEDTPEHAWDECPQWEEQRLQLATILGKHIPYWELAQEMLRSTMSWEAIARTTRSILAKKSFQ